MLSPPHAVVAGAVRILQSAATANAKTSTTANVGDEAAVAALPGRR